VSTILVNNTFFKVAPQTISGVSSVKSSEYLLYPEFEYEADKNLTLNKEELLSIVVSNVAIF
jgi:hypothetical protein